MKILSPNKKASFLAPCLKTQNFRKISHFEWTINKININKSESLIFAFFSKRAIFWPIGENGLKKTGFPFHWAEKSVGFLFSIINSNVLSSPNLALAVIYRETQIRKRQLIRMRRAASRWPGTIFTQKISNRPVTSCLKKLLCLSDWISRWKVICHVTWKRRLSWRHLRLMWPKRPRFIRKGLEILFRHLEKKFYPGANKWA